MKKNSHHVGLKVLSYIWTYKLKFKLMKRINYFKDKDIQKHNEVT